ncbi:MAG: hypothetical protein RMX96_20775 [Nostoc sp. ChiSLP02]|nr:hypothetical protein [Nostoc sp. DedSLP05]MDZ8102262.1 hypothetical protein [Nostoc sp. DedSLP01]MDZ8187267.1 hypothetical protein [Nostoc sp. ChiSLP02]
MIISDLNYLENTSEEVFGGTGTPVNINSKFTVKKNIVANIKETINNSYKVIPNIKDNTASLTGSADATGDNTFTSVVGGTKTSPKSSESFLEATSVSS